MIQIICDRCGVTLQNTISYQQHSIAYDIKMDLCHDCYYAYKEHIKAADKYFFNNK